MVLGEIKYFFHFEKELVDLMSPHIKLEVVIVPSVAKIHFTFNKTEPARMSLLPVTPSLLELRLKCCSGHFLTFLHSLPAQGSSEKRKLISFDLRC